MRKLGSIIQSLVLSALIVALGVGVAFVNCCHAGTTELAYVTELGEGGQGSSCADGTSCQRQCCGDSHTGKDASCIMKHGSKSSAMPDCMSVKVLKLAPFSQVEHFSFHFQDIPHLLPLIAWNVTARSLTVMGETTSSQMCTGQVSPPRAYLHLLRILRL